MSQQNRVTKACVWTAVIGNGKRMSRKWRKQRIQGELDIIDYTGRERTVYAPGYSTNGQIVDDDMMTSFPRYIFRFSITTSFTCAICKDVSSISLSLSDLHLKWVIL